MFDFFKPSIDNITNDILIKTYGQEHYGNYLPIDPIYVAVKNGLTVVAQSDIFGKYNSHTETIYYRPSNNRILNRLNLAHQLGHYFLHPTKEMPEEHDDIFNTKATGIEEEANMFALSLLMPKNLVGTLIEIKRINDINYMAHNWFDVSTNAMKYRLKQLNYLKKD